MGVWSLGWDYQKRIRLDCRYALPFFSDKRLVTLSERI
jgi:hypothetical protein